MSDIHPLYRHIEFAPYEYREYPKMVYPNVDSPDPKKAKTGVVVNSEAEEAEALGTGTVVREDDERKRLTDLAQASGVLADKRWGAERLRKALTAAGVDPDPQ